MLAPKNAHPEAWADFKAGPWEETIDVRDFIQRNYTPYTGDGSFLTPATEATTQLWGEVMEGIKVENKTHAPLQDRRPDGLRHHQPRPRLH